MGLATLIMLAAACKKKFEIIPDGAKQVSREDKAEADASLREYSFSLAGENYVCEAREFSDAASAKSAAKKSMAERPAEEQKSDKAHFALSGRSVWLLSGKKLAWCMLSSGKNNSIQAAMQPIREIFLMKYKEAS